MINALDSFAEFVGKKVSMVFEYFRFMKELIEHCYLVVFNIHLTFDQMYAIGITSIPLVVITSIFTGGVSAWQSAYQFADLIPLTYVGMVVGKSVIMELGPMLTALVVAGRIGAAMCAELGTMAVTEQLDAMKCLNLNPYRYLLAPRLVATIIMLPVLTIISAFVGIMGAYIVAHFGKGISYETFFYGVRLFYTDKDMAVGLIKGLIFGYIIASFGCFFGYLTKNGAEGVGKSTKAAVVASMISILISGFFVSKILL